ncbi:MAG: endonuclease/exonuclease/phosphatase family protein [Planctomycetota bacterium]
MRLCVVSYNIHKCVGGIDRRYNPDRVCETIAHYQPDIALLQEVAQGKRFRGDVQVDRLAETLGFRHRVSWINVRRKSGDYGNAVLSRFPVIDHENINITVGPNIKRSVLHARLKVTSPQSHSRVLHVFNLHLGLSELERRIQLNRFVACKPFAGLPHRAPIFVGGDFNDLWGRLRTKLEPFGFRAMKRPIRTFPAFAPLRPLDSIYVRGDLELESVQSSRLQVARQASDHLPLIAHVNLTGL